MPDMSGLEALKKAARVIFSIELPVIRVTAKNQSEDIVKALDLGQTIIKKPGTFRSLWRALPPIVTQAVATRHERE